MLFTSKFRLVTHMISYFFFNYIHQILVHCHSACFCNRHPFNLLLHCFLCIFIEMITDNIDCLAIFFVNVFPSVFVYTIWICENIRYDCPQEDGSWLTIHRFGKQYMNGKITQYAMLQDKVLDNHTLDRLKNTHRILVTSVMSQVRYLFTIISNICLHAQ